MTEEKNVDTCELGGQMARICGKPGCNNHADVPHNKYWCKDHAPEITIKITELKKWYDAGWNDCQKSREAK